MSKPEDLLLYLFLSRRSGVGSRLLKKVEVVAKAQGIIGHKAVRRKK